MTTINSTTFRCFSPPIQQASLRGWRRESQSI